MILRTTFLAFLLVMPAAAQAQPPGAGTIQASNAFLGCLIRAARKLDDGHSAASAVAGATQSACANEERRWEDAQTANYSAEKKLDFQAGIKAHTAVIATQIVLEGRR